MCILHYGHLLIIVSIIDIVILDQRDESNAITTASIVNPTNGNGLHMLKSFIDVNKDYPFKQLDCNNDSELTLYEVFASVTHADMLPVIYTAMYEADVNDDKNIDLVEYEKMFDRIKTIAIYSILEYAQRNIEKYDQNFDQKLNDDEVFSFLLLEWHRAHTIAYMDVFKSGDIDDDNAIDCIEFANFLVNFIQHNSSLTANVLFNPASLVKLYWNVVTRDHWFAHIDANNDHFVSTIELDQAFGQQKKTDTDVYHILADAFKAMDTNDDQQISIDEYGTAFKLIKEYFFYRIDGAGINALNTTYLVGNIVPKSVLMEFVRREFGIDSIKYVHAFVEKYDRNADGAINIKDELSYRFVQHLATFLPLPYAGPKDGFQLAKYLFLNANDNEQIKIEPIKKPIDDM